MQPVDVYSYRGAVTSLRARAWAEGLLAIWGGNQYGQSGPAPELSARAWGNPQSMGPFYLQNGLTTAPDGTVWMAFSSPADKAIYVQQLDPQIGAWDVPKLVAYAITPNTAPDWTRLAFGADGTLHVTWAEYQLPDGFPPVGMYYAQSADGGDTWTTPREAGPAGANQPDVVAGPDEQVYLSWVGMAGMGGKYVRISSDGGLTWTDDIAVFPESTGGGSQGSVLMAPDSRGQLHAIVAHNGCIWHFFLEGETFSSGECISESLPRETLKEFPAMSIGLGNQLHVLFWTDRRQLWHTTRTLDAPGFEPQVLPTAAPATATTAPPTVAVVPTGTPLPDFGPPPDPGAAADAATLAIVAGVAPVVLFFLLVGLVRVRGRKQPG